MGLTDGDIANSSLQNYCASFKDEYSLRLRSEMSWPSSEKWVVVNLTACPVPLFQYLILGKQYCTQYYLSQQKAIHTT
jgi:hypothetical protein